MNSGELGVWKEEFYGWSRGLGGYRETFKK